MKNICKTIQQAKPIACLGLVALITGLSGCAIFTQKKVTPLEIIPEYRKYDGQYVIVTPLDNGMEEIKYPNGIIELRELGCNPTEEDRIRVLNRKLN